MSLALHEGGLAVHAVTAAATAQGVARCIVAAPAPVFYAVVQDDGQVLSWGKASQAAAAHITAQPGHVLINDTEHATLNSARDSGRKFRWVGSGALVGLPPPPGPGPAAEARRQRDDLLRRSDLELLRLTLPDRPTASAGRLAAMRAYRQALRDVPAQPGFPAKIVWPSVPA